MNDRHPALFPYDLALEFDSVLLPGRDEGLPVVFRIDDGPLPFSGLGEDVIRRLLDGIRPVGNPTCVCRVSGIFAMCRTAAPDHQQQTTTGGAPSVNP